MTVTIPSCALFEKEHLKTRAFFIVYFLIFFQKKDDTFCQKA